MKHNSGYMVPAHSKIGQEMRIPSEKLFDKHGKNELIPVCFENDTPHFYPQCESVRAVFFFFLRESTVGNENGRAVRL